MTAVWHFFVQNGALHSLVNGVIMLLLGGVVKLLRDLIEHQKRTNDLLRTDTPGGLGDLIPPSRTKKPVPPK